jgi:hypothetical protein
MTAADRQAGGWRDFSLNEGGALFRLGRALGLGDGDTVFVRLGLLIALATWLPLLLLTAFEGVLWSGPAIPFLQSLGTHARLLLSIPLFFVAELAFNTRVRDAIRAIVHAQVVPAHALPRLDAALRQAVRWRDAWVVEAAVLVLTAIFIWDGVRSDLPADISTWRTAGGRLTMAGWWYTAVSLPAFQFLLWRWCARLLIWSWLLWAIRGLDLHLVPTHPDLAGGLGALGVAHVSLAPMNFATSAMLVASYAEQILYGEAAVRDFVLPLAGVVVGNTFLSSAPLLLFAFRLIEAKQQGRLDYGILASGYVRAFDGKWVRNPATHDASLLGSADLQSLADLGNSFAVVRSMRIVPIAPSQLVLLAAATVVPMLPLILFVVPADEIIIRSLRTLFNV